MLILTKLQISAQVAINADTSSPAISAMLDVKSTSKGMLVPRMTATQRDAISNPANGLLIFCTTNNQYYFYQGSPVSPNWFMLNSQWITVPDGICYNAGKVGVGTTSPVEKVDVTDGNICINVTLPDMENAFIMKKILSGTGISGAFHNPMFSLGRIVKGGDGDPEFRVLYYDEILKKEKTVLEFDRKGIIASVKPDSTVEQRRGSHFEGFYSGAVQPYFRLNSYPRMRLEMGDGGGDSVDVAMERLASKKLGFYTANACQVVIDSIGKIGIGTQTPSQKLQVHGMIFSSSLGFKFPDSTIQTTAAIGKSSWSNNGNSIYFNNGNVGIGTDKPKSKVEIANGDLLISNNNSGLIVTSPNGKRWKIIVNDKGEIKTLAVSQ